MPNNRVSQGIWIAPGDPEKVDDTRLFAPGFLGARFIVKQPGPPGSPGVEDYRNKEYQYIRTDSSMTVTPFKGAVAWWADKAQYLTTTDPTKLGRGQVAGVYQNAITKGNYGCIQVGGPATVKYIDAPTAAPSTAGLFVVPSATAAKADCLAAGTAALYPHLGYSASAINAGDQTGIVDMDCPRVP